MTKNEIWGWLKNNASIGMRPDHFRSKQGSVSSVRDDMVKNETRCFEVAVIVTDSEEERKNLEEYIIICLNMSPFT